MNRIRPNNDRLCQWEPLIFRPLTNTTSLLQYQIWCKFAHGGFWANAWNITIFHWRTVISVEPLVHCVVCLSVVCNVLYCGETVRPSEKLSEGGALCSTNVPDNSGTVVCDIFLCAWKIRHAGCEVVKWAHYEAEWGIRAIFCTLKTTSGFIFLPPVVWSDLATNRKPVGLVSKAIPPNL